MKHSTKETIEYSGCLGRGKESEMEVNTHFHAEGIERSRNSIGKLNMGTFFESMKNNPRGQYERNDRNRSNSEKRMCKI